MMAKIDLTKHFDPLSAGQWKQLIQYDLGGDGYTESLVWDSPDGINVKPFYSHEDLVGTPPLPPHRGTGWKIAQEIKVTNVALASDEARCALDQGAEAIQFLLSSDTRADELLAGIDTALIPVHFRFGSLPGRFVPELLESLPESPAGVFLHLDVLGHLTRSGSWYANRREDFEALRNLLSKASSDNVHFLGVDGTTYHNAGATIVQQLAYCLAHANEYLNAFGVDLRRPPVFTLAIGPEYFFEIAKFRALRTLWAILAEEYAMPPHCHIVAVPGVRNKTIYDYNTNLLRTASECMSAILGNADTVTSQPYDLLFRETNDFSTRLARNQLLILRNESGFNEVSAAADGAYFIETITRQLAEKSLVLFKQLEAGGGFLQQLQDHKIQKKVGESAGREQRKFDLKEKVMVGANHLQQSGDKMKGHLGFSPFGPTRAVKTVIEPLAAKRLASLLEKKRLDDE